MNNINDRGIYTDLIREFRNHRHRMYVVSPDENNKKTSSYVYSDSDVNFLKVKIGPLKKNNMFQKGLNTLLVEPLFKRAIVKHYKDIKFDLVLYSTPPITFSNIIEYIKKRDGAKSYLLLKDIFPQNAVDLNFIKKNSFIYKFFKKKEKKLYELSDHIGCMSPANVEYILKNNKGIQKCKVEVNPNSINPVVKVKVNKAEVLSDYGLLQDKINLFYGGSLGKPQGIEFLVKCIKANINNDKVHFIIVGTGTQEHLIDELIQNDNPVNLTFIKSLPKDEYDQLVAASDVGLIFLNKHFTIPNFPSRLLPYMEASLPIFTVTDSATDIGSIAEKNNFGYKCFSDDLEMFNECLSQFYDYDKRKILGSNARKYLEDHYSVKHSYETVIKHFEKERLHV